MLRRTLEMRHMQAEITTHHSFTTHQHEQRKYLKYVKGNTSYQLPRTRSHSLHYHAPEVERIPRSPFHSFTTHALLLQLRHYTNPPGLASYETHSRARAGGWDVLRGGCANRLPSSVPRGRPKGG
jgi:hypothetical protein